MIDRTQPPAISQFNSLQIPALNNRHSSDGIKILHLDTPDTGVITLSIIFDSGVAEADSDSEAHAIGISMMNHGSVNHPNGALTELLDYHGVRTNISTHDHHTEFTFSILRHKLHDVAPLIAELLHQPTFDHNALNIYSQNAAQAYLLHCQKVNFRAERTLLPHIMGADHPRAKVATDTDFLAITRDAVTTAHQRVVNSSVTIYFAGKYDENIQQELLGIFGQNHTTRTGAFNILPHTPYGLGQTYCDHMPDKLQSCITMALPTIGRDNPDYIPLRHLIIALGGYFGGRLMTNIREDKGLTYGISSALYGAPEGAYIGITSMTDNANVEAVITETQSEIKRLWTEKFTDNEFETVRSYIMSQLASSLNTPQSILSYHTTLKTAFIPDRDYFDHQFRLARTMTPDTFIEIANKYLNGRDWTIAVAGSQNN